MALHQEIAFETDICNHLAQHGWLYGAPGAEGDADLAVGLEAADPRPVAGARIDDHEGTFPRVGHHALGRQDPVLPGVEPALPAQPVAHLHQAVGDHQVDDALGGDGGRGGDDLRILADRETDHLPRRHTG